jgi:hypothetical protein
MLGAALAYLVPLSTSAYPGGTPNFQTDVAPYCAACHSSLNEGVLEGAGEMAVKELVEKKHLALIMAGERGYGELSEADRATLIEHIRATDANSKIELEYPPQVAPGETFQLKVNLSGGGGPVVGVALVDRPHRWFARPASATGWMVVGAPTVIGPKGPQSEWINRRPEDAGRGITFVNIGGIESDASTGKWASARAIFTLKAPDKPGDYPLVGVFFYGTEKASPLGYKTNPLGLKQVRGTYAGGSGRVLFTPEHVITVK